jgi:hypothetical protein
LLLKCPLSPGDRSVEAIPSQMDTKRR